ncbi:hypothetical protein LTS18_001414, partial [Coniosporium uncinatum]
QRATPATPSSSSPSSAARSSSASSTTPTTDSSRSGGGPTRQRKACGRATGVEGGRGGWCSGRRCALVGRIC